MVKESVLNLKKVNFALYFLFSFIFQKGWVIPHTLPYPTSPHIHTTQRSTCLDVSRLFQRAHTDKGFGLFQNTPGSSGFGHIPPSSRQCSHAGQIFRTYFGSPGLHRLPRAPSSPGFHYGGAVIIITHTTYYYIFYCIVYHSPSWHLSPMKLVTQSQL